MAAICSFKGRRAAGRAPYGSSVICDLLAAGKRVAVTSTSHTAIHNLLHKVEVVHGRSEASRFRGRYKH